MTNSTSITIFVLQNPTNKFTTRIPPLEIYKLRSFTMKTIPKLMLISALIAQLFDEAIGHGRLVDPPSRSTMWRYGFNNPPNYDDNQLYCGGVQVQYETNGGRCGVCGDPYNTSPRENEPGGKYANGIIVRSYSPGNIIDVVVELTANHKGYFEFHLCVNDDPYRTVDQTCFDQYILPVVQDGSEFLKYHVPNLNGYQKLELKVKLPTVRCKNCVLQWKYNAGNSWGVDPTTGTGCIGCGNQEQFYGCADVAIGHDDIPPGYSLITGKIEKDQAAQDGSGMRTPATSPSTTKGSMYTKESFSTKARTSSSEVFGYEDFEEFRKRFKNSHIRPCVCHSCVGSTCVCECFISDSGADGVSCLQNLAVMFASVLLSIFFII